MPALEKGGIMAQRRCFLAACFLALALLLSSVLVGMKHPASAEHESSAGPSHALVARQSTPVLFVENVGQFDPPTGSGQVTHRRFQVRGASSAGMWLATDAIWLTLLEPGHPQESAPADMQDRSQPRTGVHLRLSFGQANPNPQIVPIHRLDTHISYFRGSDPARWHAGVPVWGGVRYVDLYPGIDLELAAENGEWTWRMVTRPGADLDVVRLQVEGADALILSDTHLQLHTAAGAFTLPLIELGPEAAERCPQATRLETGAWQVSHPFFSLSHHSSPPDTADSLHLHYSTFLGGSESEVSYAVAVDAAGNAYVTGYTESTDFPTTPGAFDTTCGGCGYWHEDAFVAKLGADGSGLVYATFLGGDGWEHGTDIAVDNAGSAYVAGGTASPDFPTTPWALDRDLGGEGDAFAAKLNPSGTALVYATFLGGSSQEAYYHVGIAVDGPGNAYLTGHTDSSDFPVTAGAFDTTSLWGDEAFVAKLNATGTGLTYATFLGGNMSDYGYAIAVDGMGSAYVTGHTYAHDFPVTPGAFDPVCDECWFGTGYDAFVARFNSDGSDLIYASYLGGNDVESGRDIAVDGTGQAYVVGRTRSPDFPVTPGAYDTACGTDGDCNPDSNGLRSQDVYVVKVNASGTELVYGTFLGGSEFDEGLAIALDSTGNVYLTGDTASPDFPTTPGAFDTTLAWSDAFVAILNNTATELMYATFLGGEVYDYGRGIALGGLNSIYVTGETFSPDYPTTASAFDTSHNGAYDAFVTKLALHLGKVADPVYAYRGTPITYTIGYNHPGNAAAASLSLGDDLPALINFQAGSLWASSGSPSYDPAQRRVTWNGAMAPGGSVQVRFAVTVTCDAPRTLSQIQNVVTATVDGQAYQALAVTTLATESIELRASTPSFLPASVFTPSHTVLLYTVSEGYAPHCCPTCDDYYVVVNELVGSPLKMKNDGAGQANRTDADLVAGDCHHSLWFTPTATEAYTLDLYAVPTGSPFSTSHQVDRLELSVNPLPQLVVLTDLRELFHEFNRTELNSASSDTNGNCVRDYYEAVERMRQYAEDHEGVVLDVRQNGYASDYAYPAGTATRKNMGQDIDRRLIPALGDFLLPPENLSVIGDDAVVPFYRLPVPTQAFSETGFPTEVDGVAGLKTGADNNPTLRDSASQIDGAIKGHLMSDLPYATFETTLDTYPVPDMNAGRIHYSRPLGLVAGIDAYEEPLELRSAFSRAAALYLADEASLKWERIFHRAIRPVLRAHYGLGTQANVHYNKPATYWDGSAYLYNGAATQWDAATTARRAAQNTDLLLFYSHADHLSWQSDSGRDIDRTDLADARPGLALSTGCHSGYNTAYQQNDAGHAYYRRSLVRALLDRHVAYFAPTVYGTGSNVTTTEHDLLLQNFLQAALSERRRTIGEAYHAAFSGYTAPGDSAADKDMDKYVLYGTNFFGLPTQPLQQLGATMGTLRSSPVSSSPPSSASLQSPTAILSTTESITLSHFAVTFDAQGRAAFDLPHQGGRAGESFGPLLPAVYRTYPLPLAATDISVALLDTQSHVHPQAVDLQTVTPHLLSVGPLSGDFTYTDPYPALLLQTRLVTDGGSLVLDLTALPLQYDPDTGSVTLYDRLTYRLEYTAPTTVTAQHLTVNEGAPVAVGSSAVPVSLTLDSAIPLSGTLVWAVEDGAGIIMSDGLAELSVPAGTSALGWDVDASAWMPGLMHLWVMVRDANDAAIASGWADFWATGQWLTVEMGQGAYDENDGLAEVWATVRGETGVGVDGQAGGLSLWLDGNPVAATWHPGADGLYTSTVGLGGLQAGGHVVSSTLEAHADSGGFLLDLSPPVSAVWLTQTGTVTTAWAFVEYSDDASGPLVITVEHQVDGGDWLFWRTFRPGYLAGHDAVYGPIEPVVVDTTEHTYCFRSQAQDQVGHVEPAHAEPDACIFPMPYQFYLPLVPRKG